MIRLLRNLFVDPERIAANIAILNYADRTGTKPDGINDLRKLIDQQVAAYLAGLQGKV